MSGFQFVFIAEHDDDNDDDDGGGGWGGGGELKLCGMALCLKAASLCSAGNARRLSIISTGKPLCCERLGALRANAHRLGNI